jgi:signal transduction histidine kinase
MAYQARIAAELRERLGVAADRNRIAMDMHDGVQGHLITIASQLELIGHVAPRDGDRAAEISREGREMARQAADELRFLVQRLRAPALADGFVPALRQYAHNICERSGLRLTFEVHGDPRPLEPEVENVLFRIAQESLNNVMKHAGASEVSVCVSFDRERASLQIEDNGKGFQPEACADGCVGLASMRERAERQHGNLVIDSAPSKGTTVSATFAA